ncbi:hypothetical protein LCGC14_0378380 [marine sediment metagenome]|uniref:LamG-like jellyroll fold domain-containing protein n=1 Tax=marine sediment metagenome TaxID=412755 RepID=A0A0F9T2U3_9ZZZZ
MILPDGPLIRSQFSVHRFNTDTKALWNAIYHNRQTQLGNTATLVNFGDESNAGLVTASTFTGMKYHASGLSPIWTPSSALSAFATPFLLGASSNWKQHIPVLTMDGVTDEMDTPDNAFWSDAGAFSVGAWIYLNTIASNVILAKWDETTSSEDREFHFSVDSNGDIGFTIYDETNNAAVGRKDDVALTVNTWYFVVGTFSGGTDAADVSIYIDGVATDDADIVDDAGFANEVAGATITSLGYLLGTSTAKEQLFDGIIAGGPCGPFFVLAELTAEQIANLYRLERLALDV